MNPQYMPQQQLGGPPQGFQQPPAPASNQGFQNIPLGGHPGKTPQQQLQNAPPQQNILLGPTPASAPGQLQHGMGPPPNIKGQIPSNQLPPSNIGHTPHEQKSQGPQQVQFAPHVIKSGGPVELPQHNMQNGPQSQLQSAFQNGANFGQNSLQTQTGTTSSNEQGKPPGGLITGSAPPGMFPPPPQNQTHQKSSESGLPVQPAVSAPQSSAGHSYLPGPPMTNLSGPNKSIQSHMQSPIGQNSHLQHPSPGPLNMQPPPPSQSNMQPPNQSNMQPPPNQLNMQPPPGQNSHLQHPPTGQMPPLPNPSSPSLPPLPGQGFPGKQPFIPSIGQPQTNQFGQQFRPPMGQPPMGQPPVGQPPLPNMGAQNVPQMSSQYNQSLPPQLGQPSMTNQNQFNHMTNQMQGMSMGGPRQYSGPPMKGALNGDNGPHMPPQMPGSQPGYVNGQQLRGPQQPGYPPLPGQPGQMPPAHGQMGTGSYPQPAYAQQQQQQQNRRLDPDQMPNPIQVTQDDQINRAGIFCTNQKGLVPPLVTTNFIVQDQGNASPRFMRSTMYNVPISQDIMKQTAVPFSLVISPMARTLDQEYAPPIVNFGELGPVRCIRCKAYMCPFMQFVDSGRRFQCLFCRAATDVPQEYFQHLDHTGQRMDRYERPELMLGTYEFVATADYCRNNVLPKPPAVIFIIDVSYNNVKSGLINLLCSQMKEIIKNLPVDQGHEKSNMKVGFITYNSTVHFYNIKGTLAAPQMMVVGDTQEMFMPLLDGFLCTPEESGTVIDALMQQIPQMFADTRETETVLLPAIVAGLEALKASECTGKLMVFHSSLPTSEAPGKLKNREDRKLLGTDKERTILQPQSQVYNQLGQDCVGAGCSVDLFLFNNAYIDIATIGQVSRLTGGEVFKYTYFQADIDGERVIKDVITDISRPIAFDAIMRVRTSTGVRPTDFYGHMFMSNTTDMELAAIDCDKAVAIEIKHDDKLNEEEGVYIQAALLYTSCSGQRRLRIINLSLKTCSQMADLYRSCDLDTVVNYLAKQSVYKLLEHNPKTVKDNIVNRAAQILATYRKNCASPSSAGQLILPECMKLLPLYTNCLLKSDALSGGSEMTLDDRSFTMMAVMTMDVPTSVNHFYPRLIPIHDLETSQEPPALPSPIRTTVEKMNEQGVYILENGIHMFLWIGLGANPEFTQKVFNAPSAIQIDIEKPFLPKLENPLSDAVRALIEEIRIQRHRCMRLTIVRQREKLEPVFKHFLVEDRGTDGSASYVDFLCHMHKEIRTLLS